MQALVVPVTHRHRAGRLIGRVYVVPVNGAVAVIESEEIGHETFIA